MQAMLRNRILLSIVLLLVQYWSMATAAQTNISSDHSALLALKSHITNDPQNMILANWSTPSSICNWVGVTCGSRHLRVTVLDLAYMGVTGTIPPELGNLSFLVELRFRNNSFHGTIPQELSHLRRLKYLSFGFNNFKGTIPSWLGSLSELQALNLYGNKFSGSIPTDIFNLSAMQMIDLRFNQISDLRSNYQVLRKKTLGEIFSLTLALYGALAYSSPSFLLYVSHPQPSLSHMASIDAITASCAASLALAEGGSAPDLGIIGGGPVHRSSKPFMIGKPLTCRPVNPMAFKAHLLCTWMDVTLVMLKKKSGKLLGSRNKNHRPSKKPNVAALRLSYPAVTGIDPSPSDKGKGKL